MKLYLLSQDKVSGWDTFDSMVVSAESEQDARNIHPSQFVTHVTDGEWMGTYKGGVKTGQEYIASYDSWVSYSDIDYITVEYLGETEKQRGVICASFNSG